MTQLHAQPDVTLSAPPAARRPAVPMRRHLLVAACFALLAMSFQVHRTGWRGAAEAAEGDLGNIAAFAAGHDHPEYFVADNVLGDGRNFHWYATAHVPLARWLRPLAGSYAGALLAGYGLHIFAHLLGFYLLGIVLFGSVLWSVVLALVALAPVSAGIVYDGWGLFDDPLPRLTFSALTGFLMAAAIKWRQTPKAWPVLMLAAGCGAYVHPVSAPAVGLMLYLGLWAHRPRGWSLPGWIARMAGLGVLFLLPAVPFALKYATGRQDAPSAADPMLQEIYRYFFVPQVWNVPYAMKLVVKAMFREGTAVLGIVGAILLLRAGKWRQGPLRPFVPWLVGIALVGMAMPLADYFRAVRRGAVCMQVDLERNVRFFVPILLTLFVWGLAELDRRANGRAVWAKVGLLVATAWFAAHGGVSILMRPAAAVEVLRTGKPADIRLAQRAQAVAAVRELTPAGARVLPWNFPSTPIRHAALRPVVHARQDASCLIFSKRELAMAWYERQRMYDEIDRLPKGPERLQAIVYWGRQNGAQYLLIDEPHRPGEPLSARATSIWSNEQYSLLRLSDAE